ncbi:leucyl/phenylalanyl-tRNA--protein transferase [Pseudoroseicyclus sp. CLL3-39]|uniref:Leucyl/phenylalanyl-tRNA--protein transferase n=2 Tax=Pseudoroseicyclus tamaricis TaxID=2705421 RepID=A0A6B2JXD8_9RHOB|nr:leucyl/phenylalanyl-tRNA--protein transferase [Pseudoroseicyclus tamaricis]
MSAERLLGAYAAGIFPMSEGQDDPEVFWVDPRFRGVIPLGGFHISRSLARRIRRGGYEVTANRDFGGVLAGCADRPSTWINAEIAGAYGALHEAGHCSSVEVWQDGALVGGTYGVTLGGAWFGESMFSRRADASKLALAHLVHRLRLDGFTLFDTQFLTPHLASLGAVEIPRMVYRRRLANALRLDARFRGPAKGMPPPPLTR